jgi:hypothetical protein
MVSSHCHGRGSCHPVEPEPTVMKVTLWWRYSWFPGLCHHHLHAKAEAQAAYQAERWSSSTAFVCRLCATTTPVREASR